MNEIYCITVDCANGLERRLEDDDWDFWEAMADFCTIRDLIAAQRADKEVGNGK